MSINRTFATGTVEQAEAKTFGEDGKVTNFRLVNDDTTYRCSAFGEVAAGIVDDEFVLVEGRQRTRHYKTKEGEERSVTELIVNSIDRLNGVDDGALPF